MRMSEDWGDRAQDARPGMQIHRRGARSPDGHVSAMELTIPWNTHACLSFDVAYMSALYSGCSILGRSPGRGFAVVRATCANEPKTVTPAMAGGFVAPENVTNEANPATMAVNPAPCREENRQTKPPRRRGPAESARTKPLWPVRRRPQPARIDKAGEFPLVGQLAQDPTIMESCMHSLGPTHAAPG